MSIDIQQMSLSDKVRKQGQLRHNLLKHIMDTSDLAGLHKHVFDGLQVFAECAEKTDTDLMRREVSRKLEERLLRCITMFTPGDKDKPSDPQWLLEAIENLGTEELDYNVLKHRITERLCSDIVYFPKESVTDSLDYFYDLAAKLEIDLDDKKIEEAVYYRAERHLERSTTYKEVVLVNDFLNANLPVGRSFLRQSPTMVFVSFGDVHETFDLA